MGDAGPQIPVSAPHPDDVANQSTPSPNEAVREVNVLVTGFGPFKSYRSNPSFMIAAALATTLDPSSHHEASALRQHQMISLRSPVRPPNKAPYRINVHVYPNALRVAYATIAEIIPRLTASSAQPRYDYVFHIGMAGGRSTYTLETNAHRDHYKIKDVDERDGFACGEGVWKCNGFPEILEVGWDQGDVLSRWECLTRAREDGAEAVVGAKVDSAMVAASQHGQEEADVEGAKSVLAELDRDALRRVMFGNHGAEHELIKRGKKAVVKLSRDAGRYLCEFILYTSLSVRYQEARKEKSETANKSQPASGNDLSTKAQAESVDELQQVSEDESARDRVGKVAFLHVPGGTDPSDIARGVRVAESAILALVGSWEDGYRKEHNEVRAQHGLRFEEQGSEAH